MNTSTEAYNKKVWAFLNKMKPGQRHKVNELCEAANKEKFIAAIKAWMYPLPYQGGLSFNADFSEFYMVHVPDQALKSLNNWLACMLSSRDHGTWE